MHAEGDFPDLLKHSIDLFMSEERSLLYDTLYFLKVCLFNEVSPRDD